MTLMSETAPRTLEVINQEYANLCAQLGEIIANSEEMVQTLKNRIRELQYEAKSIQPKEPKPE